MLRNRLNRLEETSHASKHFTADMIVAWLTEVTGVRDPRKDAGGPPPKRLSPQAARDKWVEMFGWDPGPVECLSND